MLSDKLLKLFKEKVQGVKIPELRKKNEVK
jgi:hypothetical protein